MQGDFEHFQRFNFEASFLKNENLEYRFLVESTNIQSAAFSHKNALPKAKRQDRKNREDKINLSQRKHFYHKVV